MDERDFAYRRLNSNITPISRIGKPAKSKYTRYANLILENDPRLGLLKGGNIVSGLTSGLKSYLGFRGAREDYENEKAYNEYLAMLAEQERQDALEKAAAEQDYKERALAQQAELKQQELAAQEARAKTAREQQLADMALKRQQELEDLAAKQAYEKEIFERNRQVSLEDKQAEIAAKEEAQRLQDLNAVAAKSLTPEQYQKWRENPLGFGFSGRNWFGRVLGIKAGLKKRGPQSPLQSQKEQKTQAQKELDKLWGE